MTDDAFFQTCLNARGDDNAARLLFAEWLAAPDESYASMADHHKRPLPGGRRKDSADEFRLSKPVRRWPLDEIS